MDYSIISDIAKYGEVEAFRKPVDCILTIKGLQLLLESSNDFYPDNYKDTYKAIINNLIKGYTKLLEEEMIRLHNYFELSEHYKEDN